jgi:hypothetical protein
MHLIFVVNNSQQFRVHLNYKRLKPFSALKPIASSYRFDGKKTL